MLCVYYVEPQQGCLQGARLQGALTLSPPKVGRSRPKRGLGR